MSQLQLRAWPEHSISAITASCATFDLSVYIIYLTLADPDPAEVGKIIRNKMCCSLLLTMFTITIYGVGVVHLFLDPLEMP